MDDSEPRHEGTCEVYELFCSFHGGAVDVVLEFGFDFLGEQRESKFFVAMDP